MTPARKSAPVSNLDEHRLRKLLSEEAERLAKLNQTRERIAAFCREWSFANGYGVVLRPEQVSRAMERGEGR